MGHPPTSNWPQLCRVHHGVMCTEEGGVRVIDEVRAAGFECDAKSH